MKYLALSKFGNRLYSNSVFRVVGWLSSDSVDACSWAVNSDGLASEQSLLVDCDSLANQAVNGFQSNAFVDAFQNLFLLGHVSEGVSSSSEMADLVTSDHSKKSSRLSSLGDSAEDSVVESISDLVKLVRHNSSWDSDVLIPALLSEKSLLALSDRLNVVELDALSDGSSIGTSVRYSLTISVSSTGSDL